MTLPTIELSRPPTTPGGAVFLVKTSSDNPPTPFHSSVARIIVSMVRPKAVAAYARTVKITLRLLRLE